MSISYFNNECHCYLSLEGAYFQDQGSNPIFRNLCLPEIEVVI